MGSSGWKFLYQLCVPVVLQAFGRKTNDISVLEYWSDLKKEKVAHEYVEMLL